MARAGGWLVVRAHDVLVRQLPGHYGDEAVTRSVPQFSGIFANATSVRECCDVRKRLAGGFAGAHNAPMILDSRTCYRALKARDARFDGRFFVAVSSTRIYCRPVCTVRPPRR